MDPDGEDGQAAGEPQCRSGHGPGRVGGGWPLDGGPVEGDAERRETTEVDGEPDGRELELAGRRGTRGQHDPRDQDGQGLARGAFGTLAQAGAQHRGSERHDGPGHGQPHPAEHVHQRVGEHQLVVQGFAGISREGCSESGADGQETGCRDVVAHHGREP